MDYRLLLVDGHGAATVSALRLRTLREFPGQAGLSVHFRPIRNDRLFDSARVAGSLAYRVLYGEGVTRAQLWVEYEAPGAPLSVTGRSSDLLFALALITSVWQQPLGALSGIAATGTLDETGAVQGVNHTVEKLAAAVHDLAESAQATVFYPAANAEAVNLWRATAAIPTQVSLIPVAHLEEALGYLGYHLEKVYLGNPFRGLAHFDYEHHAIFFGRDREIEECLRLLLRREQAGSPGLLIEGASGSGKSSFLRAGVLPALVRARSLDPGVGEALRQRPVSADVRHATWRPGLLSRPVDEGQIVASIRAGWAALLECTSDRWLGPWGTLDELAERRLELWPSQRRFVWLIDQFEEILNLGAHAALLETFGRFLLRLQTEGVWTLASARAEAVPLLKGVPSLRRVFGANEGQYYLPTLTGTALDDVITLPAKAADLTFGIAPDGRHLDQYLREDAYRERDGLPLLQFTLNELYLRRSGSELSYAAYQQLGGLTGSIATTADAVLAEEAEASKAVVARLFRGLVGVDDQGRATRRYAPLADFAADPRQQLSLIHI